MHPNFLFCIYILLLCFVFFIKGLFFFLTVPNMVDKNTLPFIFSPIYIFFMPWLQFNSADASLIVVLSSTLLYFFFLYGRFLLV